MPTACNIMIPHNIETLIIRLPSRPVEADFTILYGCPSVCISGVFPYDRPVVGTAVYCDLW